jgi:hypothetical protein
MCPVSLDCPMFFLPSVSSVTDVSSVSRLPAVLCLSHLCVLVFLMFQVSLDCPMFCLPSVSCVPDVSSVSRFSVVLCLSYFCVKSTRHISKTNKAQQTI